MVLCEIIVDGIKLLYSRSLILISLVEHPKLGSHMIFSLSKDLSESLCLAFVLDILRSELKHLVLDSVELELVPSAFFFDSTKGCKCVSKSPLCFKLISKVPITFLDELINLAMDKIESSCFSIGVFKLFTACLVEAIKMSSQQSYLLKESLILFTQHVNSLLKLFDLINTRWSSIHSPCSQS